MAHNKPYRHIEGRPSAVEINECKACMHSLGDNKKVTKIPMDYLRHVYFHATRSEFLKKCLRLKKIKNLIKRRKKRQKMIYERNNNNRFSVKIANSISKKLNFFNFKEK